MKVLLVNGSPHQKGCTYTALEEVAKTLEESGVETEIFQLGNKAINGCIGCGACRKSGECFMDDKMPMDLYLVHQYIMLQHQEL